MIGKHFTTAINTYAISILAFSKWVCQLDQNRNRANRTKNNLHRPEIITINRTVIQNDNNYTSRNLEDLIFTNKAANTVKQIKIEEQLKGKVLQEQPHNLTKNAFRSNSFKHIPKRGNTFSKLEDFITDIQG